ncbi:MAG: hypothetical protein AB7O24_29690 [Kofleriaceae bacterium]
MLFEHLAATTMNIAGSGADVRITESIEWFAQEVDKPAFALEQRQQRECAIAMVLRRRDLWLVVHWPWFFDGHLGGRQCWLGAFRQKLGGCGRELHPEQEPEEARQREDRVHRRDLMKGMPIAQAADRENHLDRQDVASKN